MSNPLPSKSGPEALRGAEVQTLDLIIQVIEPEVWGGLLKFLLEHAVAKGNGELVQVLVLAGSESGGALHEAAIRGGYGEIANDVQDRMANTCGRGALRGSEVHVLDLIFELLPSEVWTELMQSLLERAATNGCRDLAQKLTQQLVVSGAEIGDALHAAVERGHLEIVTDLLGSGASIAAKDTNGRTPLHIAARRGKTEMVQLFLRKGADKDVFDTFENTPLFMAVCFGHLAAVQALLAAGAGVSLRCREDKTPVIHGAADEGHVDILRTVIEHGAAVDAADANQHTALHFAAFKNNVEAIDVLVEAGANIEARDHRGHTPLHGAASTLSREALLCLLKHGATLNSQDDCLRTPLMWAAWKSRTRGAAGVVDSLLRAGADETAVEIDGNKAADVIGAECEEEDCLAEDVERVRKLLANAPADRVWRRRGYLVLCRAHPERLQQNQIIGGTHHSDTGRRTRSRAKLARAAGVAENSGGGYWTVAMTTVLLLREEGIFRTIVGYL